MPDLFLNELERQLHLPIPLGPFARVLVDYHKNWLLDTASTNYMDRIPDAERSYLYEYRSSTGSRLRSLSSVGGRSHTRELNELNGEIVARLALEIDGPISLMYVGGGDGATTELAYRAIERFWLKTGRSLQDIRDRLRLTFVEPSGGMMRDATSRLGNLGIQYNAFNIPAHDIPEYIEPESHDIVMETAALHHYPDPAKPYRAINRVLKKGGVFVLNEWCHSLFEHPLRFRKLLERLEWPAKKEDLERYNKYFGLEENENYQEPEDPLERAANEKMLEWYVDRFSRSVDYVFYTLEAHCPPALTIAHLHNSEFRTEDPRIDELISDRIISGNPHHLTPENSLHSSIIAIK